MESSQNPPPLSSSEQKQKESDRDTKLQQVWLSRIKEEEKAHEEMRTRLEVVEDVYTNDFQGRDVLYVPLYWQVVNVEHVGVYSNQPVPDVRPRNESSNPLFKAVSRVIGRGLEYCIDDQTFDDNFNRSVDDYLAMGLGVIRVKVDSIIIENDTGEMDFFNQPVVEETVGDQTLRWEYVPWARFGWQPTNSWTDCQWIYFRHRMTQAQIRERFGRNVSATKDNTDTASPNSWQRKTFDIYEVWDKKNKKVLFIAKGEKKPIEVVDDPLGLTKFYPVPAPMMMNLPSEELIPQSDYDYIEQYDVELNRLQERRMGLLEQIKAAGAYDKGIPEFAEMVGLEDGQMIGVQNLLARMSTAGGVDAIYWLPIKEKVDTLIQLTTQITFVKSQVDEVLGIADIVMGVTKASESATAQDIKGRWVGIRLTRKRETVQYTVREMMRIMAQLLGSHITPENLQRMTQMELSEEMIGILQHDTLMDFIIDIETESTVAKDEDAERRTYQEMLNGVAQFAQAVLPMVQQNLMPADVSSAILTAALQPYSRYNRDLDDALAEMPTSQQQMQQMTQQTQKLTQELQQSQQTAQQWQQLAQKLQMEATEAKSRNLDADTQKKGAETQEILSEIPDNQVKPIKTIAEVGKINAERIDIQSGRRNNGQ